MKNILDRKNNFNLLILVILILFFGIVIYNQRLIINTHDHVIEINEKLDKYFGPIDNIDLPQWEDNL